MCVIITSASVKRTDACCHMVSRYSPEDSTEFMYYTEQSDLFTRVCHQ